MTRLPPVVSKKYISYLVREVKRGKNKRIINYFNIKKKTG
jgi:hypothetical protein